MKIKNIAIISHHFWPENFLINNIALIFKKKNIKTTVITGLPNYPKGEIYKKYKNVKSLKKENFNGVDIIRFPIIGRKKGKFINLVLNYMSYLINGIFFLRKVNFTKSFDHIFIYLENKVEVVFFKSYRHW